MEQFFIWLAWLALGWWLRYMLVEDESSGTK